MALHPQDLDIEAIKEQGGTIPPNYIPQNEDEALAVLTQELTGQAQVYGQEATKKMQVAAVAAERLQTDAKIKSENVGLNDALNAISGDAPDPLRNLVMRVPKGRQFNATGNVSIEKDPVTGDTLIYNIPPVRTNQNDTKVMARVVDEPTRKSAATFDLTEEMEKLRSLDGEAALTQIGMTLSKIEVQLSREAQRIRQIAAIESGYTAAKAAFDRNVELDKLSPYITLGTVSAQTFQAQQQMAQALEISNSLTRGLLHDDSNIAILNSAKQELAKRQELTARRQITREERKEDRKERKEEDREAKKDEAAEVVPDTFLANYRVITGSQKDDREAKLELAQRIRKDKVMEKLVQVSPENIHAFVMDDDPKVREGALRLLSSYERARNPQYSEDETPPVTKIVKRALDNPAILVAYATSLEQKNRLQLALKGGAKSGVELKEVRAELPKLLALYVENQIQGDFITDMRAWKGTGINDNSFLAQTIKEVSDTSPAVLKGKAGLGTVVELFTAKKIKTPDGKELSFNDKVQMLTQAIETSTTNLPRGLMFNNDAVEALKLQLLDTVKLTAAREHIRSISGIYGR